MKCLNDFCKDAQFIKMALKRKFSSLYCKLLNVSSMINGVGGVYFFFFLEWRSFRIPLNSVSVRSNPYLGQSIHPWPNLIPLCGLKENNLKDPIKSFLAAWKTANILFEEAAFLWCGPSLNDTGLCVLWISHKFKKLKCEQLGPGYTKRNWSSSWPQNAKSFCASHSLGQTATLINFLGMCPGKLSKGVDWTKWGNHPEKKRV